jgi:ribulose 1,5-bisphosphate synthetase/thiazole synthase
MKTMLMLAVALVIVASVGAQTCPVQVSVQHISKKKDTPGDVTHHGGMVYWTNNKIASSMALRITLQNPLVQPVDDIVVRWGIAKVSISTTGHGAPVAYGREEKCSLKPKETKILETDSVDARSSESPISDHRSGEKILGHGVQLLIAGKLAWEEYVPGTVKPAFDNLRPMEDLEKKTKPDKSKKKN